MNYVEYTIMANMMLLGIASFGSVTLFMSIIIMTFMDFLNDKRNDNK